MDVNPASSDVEKCGEAECGILQITDKWDDLSVSYLSKSVNGKKYTPLNCDKPPIQAISAG